MKRHKNSLRSEEMPDFYSGSDYIVGKVLYSTRIAHIFPAKKRVALSLCSKHRIDRLSRIKPYCAGQQVCPTCLSKYRSQKQYKSWLKRQPV
jgi:hypothetical protein